MRSLSISIPAGVISIPPLMYPSWQLASRPVMLALKMVGNSIPEASSAFNVATLVSTTVWSSFYKEAAVMPVMDDLKEVTVSAPMLWVVKAPKMLFNDEEI